MIDPRWVALCDDHGASRLLLEHEGKVNSRLVCLGVVDGSRCRWTAPALVRGWLCISAGYADRLERLGQVGEHPPECDHYGVHRPACRMCGADLVDCDGRWCKPCVPPVAWLQQYAAPLQLDDSIELAFGGTLRPIPQPYWGGRRGRRSTAGGPTGPAQTVEAGHPSALHPDGLAAVRMAHGLVLERPE